MNFFAYDVHSERVWTLVVYRLVLFMPRLKFDDQRQIDELKQD